MQAAKAKTLESWLARYKSAWEARDPAAAGALFGENALYHETPYAEPFRGPAGVSEYWARVTADQRDVEVSVEPLGVLESGIGVAKWHAAFKLASNGAAVELDGVFLLEFNDAGLCTRLREWWHAR